MESFLSSVVLPAAVAVLVSLIVNLAVGGRLEVRKLRAVRRFEARAALLDNLRLQINWVRLLQRDQRSWESVDGRLTRFTDSFDDYADRIEGEYQRAIPLVAALDKGLEALIAQAMLFAGSHVARIRHFRDEAMGYEPDALQAETAAMMEDLDLATAVSLLEAAQRCFDVRWVRRRLAMRRLKRTLHDLERRAQQNEAPRTPLNYYVAQERATGKRPSPRRGPYKGGKDGEAGRID
jgi:hypothetical protein